MAFRKFGDYILNEEETAALIEAEYSVGAVFVFWAFLSMGLAFLIYHFWPVNGAFLAGVGLATVISIMMRKWIGAIVMGTFILLLGIVMLAILGGIGFVLVKYVDWF